MEQSEILKKIVKIQHKIKLAFLSVCFLFVLTALFHTNSLFAKTMRPVRIMLPGNFNGNTFSWKGQQKPAPNICWRLPGLISSLCKQSDYIN